MSYTSVGYMIWIANHLDNAVLWFFDHTNKIWLLIKHSQSSDGAGMDCSTVHTMLISALPLHILPLLDRMTSPVVASGDVIRKWGISAFVTPEAATMMLLDIVRTDLLVAMRIDWQAQITFREHKYRYIQKLISIYQIR